MYTIDDFAMMEPMKYYNNETPSVKRDEMLNDKDEKFIGTENMTGTGVCSFIIQKDII